MNGQRYFQYDWQAGAPQPGELEYLGWTAYGWRNSGSKTVTRDTQGTDRHVDNTTHEQTQRI